MFCWASPDQAEFEVIGLRLGHFRGKVLDWELNARRMNLARRPVLGVFGVRGLYQLELSDAFLKSSRAEPFALVREALRFDQPIKIRTCQVRWEPSEQRTLEIAAEEVVLSAREPVRFHQFELGCQDLQLSTANAWWESETRRFVVPGQYRVRNRKGEATGSGLAFSLDLEFSSWP